MGMLAGALHLPSPSMMPGTTSQGLLVGMMVGTLLLVAGLAPLSARLGGSRIQRGAAIFAMTFVALAVNTMIEAYVFSNLITIGVAWMCVHYILPCLFLTIGLVLLFGRHEKPLGLPSFSPTQWAWRVAVAWLAFPVIYLLFGMCVAPFVVNTYNAGIAGLTIPPMAVIIRTQLLRSALFLGSSLPIIALWSGSRRNLFLLFGLAASMMVGIVGLAQATWLPTVLRVAHSIEITFDSFAYVGVLVLLFASHKTVTEETTESIHPAEMLPTRS
jgi:hypothetical protein